MKERSTFTSQSLGLPEEGITCPRGANPSSPTTQRSQTDSIAETPSCQGTKAGEMDPMITAGIETPFMLLESYSCKSCKYQHHFKSSVPGFEHPQCTAWDSAVQTITLIWVCHPQALVCHEITNELQTHHKCDSQWFKTSRQRGAFCISGLAWVWHCWGCSHLVL